MSRLFFINSSSSPKNYKLTLILRNRQIAHLFVVEIEFYVKLDKSLFDGKWNVVCICYLYELKNSGSIKSTEN